MSAHDLSDLPNLARRVADGWTLEVARHVSGKFHARIWMDWINSGHNHIGSTERDALDGLEVLVQSPAAIEWDRKHGYARG